MAAYAIRRSRWGSKDADEELALEILEHYGDKVSSMMLCTGIPRGLLVVQFGDEDVCLGRGEFPGMICSARWCTISEWIKEAIASPRAAIYVRKGVFRELVTVGMRTFHGVPIFNADRILRLPVNPVWTKFSAPSAECWFEAYWLSLPARVKATRAVSWGERAVSWALEVLKSMTP